jgi:Arc/MetJ-type ribon-helix-helix transcriptional regulator
MTVTMKPDLERFVADQVSAGRFSSPTEVLEAAVARLMLDPLTDEPDALDLKEIKRGLDQMRRGEVVDWKAYSADLRKKYIAP